MYSACAHRQTVSLPDELPGTGYILPAEPEDQYRQLFDLLVLSESVEPTFPGNVSHGFYRQNTQSSTIRFYCNNYDACNKTGALIKITDYSKSVVEQTGRHVEKSPKVKSQNTISTLNLLSFNMLF